MASDSNIIPNDSVFRYYFYFMQERMNIFWRKCKGKQTLTQDPILRAYKFTNVYRVCDRVSQYLIHNVIYNNVEKYTPEDMLLRILVFKIFNKIETWEYIVQTYGEITISNFDVNSISRLLSERQLHFPIFNNAYMMTGSCQKYDYLKSKHEKWLTMVKEEFLGEGIVYNVLQANSLEEVYNLLRGCSFLGGFLAYQYAIDFNYSPYINFSEDDFVVAGIGAKRGIEKCFISHGYSYEEAIRYTKYHLSELQKKYGYNKFQSLEGHAPTLLDLQNCFCETDKFLRAKMPELHVGNKRIKQKYKPSKRGINYFFPPKWNINTENRLCSQPNIKELTISW